MFDCLVAARQPVLATGAIESWQAALSDVLDSPSGLDDAGRVDAIRALERLGCVVSAAQALLSVELDTSIRETQAARGLPAARQGRGVAHQIALARRESPHRGQRDLGVAKVVSSEMPGTWRAWRTGGITEWKATLIARETACLSRDDRLAVDAEISFGLTRLEKMGVGELAGAVRAAAARLDPASFVARRRRAEADRHVSLRPAPDTMTWLTALLPVTDGVATYAALARAAESARAAGDSRGKGQLMADALVGRVHEGDATESDPKPISLHLVMSDVDLFGVGEEPAHLDGFGPIPAELAREIVVGACSRPERVWLRRLYCRPDPGELVTGDAHGRCFRKSLARFVRLRDRFCRTPWCDAPVRHLDHARSHAEDGPTSLANAQGLCEACNYAKQAPGWCAGPSPGIGGHVVETTLPTGHRYTSRPPPFMVSMRTVPVRLDYVLTG